MDIQTAFQIMGWVGFVLGLPFGFVLCLWLVYTGKIRND